MRIYSPGSLSHGQNSESQKAEGYLQEHNFLTNTAPVPSHWNCEGQGQPHVRVRLSTARCHPPERRRQPPSREPACLSALRVFDYVLPTPARLTDPHPHSVQDQGICMRTYGNQFALTATGSTSIGQSRCVPAAACVARRTCPAPFSPYRPIQSLRALFQTAGEHSGCCPQARSSLTRQAYTGGRYNLPRGVVAAKGS